MTGSDGYEFPYTRTPGGSTPPAHTAPEEGVRGLWEFFWLSVLSTAIIAVSGVATWFLVHMH
jgi:hypothetical protein